MSSLWVQRAARNEALFREVNENIAQLEKDYGSDITAPTFICECANELCTERVSVDTETYERVRDNPRWFIVLPGHVDETVERIVEKHSSYLVVEKIGAAGDIAERES